MGRRIVVLGVVLFLAGCAQDSPQTIGESDFASTKVCATGATIEGIDVSGATPDWATVAGAGGMDFAFVKATEGVTFVNPSFATDWAGMKAAGLVRGAYCFFRWLDDPVAEADFFVSTLMDNGGLDPGDMVVLDLEDTADGDTAANKATIIPKALAFLQRVKADTGVTAIIYTSSRVFDTELGTPSGFSGYPLWDAFWPPVGTDPKTVCPSISNGWPTWAFWQFAGDTLAVPGAGSANDGSLFNGTRADLVAFADGLGGVVPPDVDAGGPPSADAAPPVGADAAAPPGLSDGTASGACGCRVAGQPKGGSAPWVILVIVIPFVGALRRRRARSA